MVQPGVQRVFDFDLQLVPAHVRHDQLTAGDHLRHFARDQAQTLDAAFGRAIEQQLLTQTDAHQGYVQPANDVVKP